MTFEQMQRMQRQIVLGQRTVAPEQEEVTVVWSGGELLPSRNERVDERINTMPHLSEEEAQPAKRKYTWSGKYRKLQTCEGLTVTQGEPNDDSTSRPDREVAGEPDREGGQTPVNG